MYAECAAQAKAFTGLVDDSRTLAHTERLKSLVFKPHDALTFVVIAYPAFEGHEPATTGVGQFRA